ncbi:MAG: response regulator transcription factor [Kouleothrix sp.]|nr:response regulator transcription factor [Kouleothrix sp.]
MEQTTILIADDSAEFRSGLRGMLQTTPDLRMVAEAEDGERTVLLALQHQPDVILMDINMPRLNGIEATQRILHSSPHIAVLMLTMFDDDDSVFAAMRAGARGYLLKGVLKADMLRAIRAVSSGEIIFGAAIAVRMIQFFAHYQPLRSPVFPELTQREREILTLMTKHVTNSEIATQLNLSEKTIRNNVSNIFNKLQVIDRAQAVVKARDAGFI